MSWLELVTTVRVGHQALVESALEDLGALSITLRDADADTPDENAIFEPGVGELPLWNDIIVQALFDASTDRGGLLHALTDLLPAASLGPIEFREIADADWTRAWMDQFKPMQFGTRLWIYPSTIEPPPDSDAVIVRLDPGLAFGTGTHPTTALCLQWLESMDLRAKSVLDFGCGSGVLAIAALKLGAATATGIDNDPQALDASRSNAQRNQVSEQLHLYQSPHFPLIAADVLVANILAGPLEALAPQLASGVVPGGKIALSGILVEQQDALTSCYSQWFDSLHATSHDGWVRVSGVRRG